MRELSLHLLDLVENAVAAGATVVEVRIEEEPAADRLRVAVSDNGAGMAPELAAVVEDPFVTTRRERPVGMGLALLSGAAEQAGGSLQVESAPGKGTRVTATFQFSSVDRAPLGRLEDTLAAISAVHSDLEFRLSHTGPQGSYAVLLREVAARTPRGGMRRELAALVSEGRAHIGSAA